LKAAYSAKVDVLRKERDVMKSTLRESIVAAHGFEYQKEKQFILEGREKLAHVDATHAAAVAASKRRTDLPPDSDDIH
jgi:hypothetical protein